MISKKVFFLVFLFLIGAVSFAQSLERAETLFNRAVNNYQSGNFHRSYSGFSESIEQFLLSGKATDEQLMTAYLWKGAAAFQLGNYDEAREMYLTSLDHANIVENFDYQINIMTALGNLENSLNNMEESSEWYFAVADLANDNNRGDINFQYREIAAGVLFNDERYEEALANYVELLKELSRNDFRYPNILQFVGASRFFSGDIKGAIEEYSQLSEILEPTNQNDEKANAQAWLAKLNLDIGEYDIAEEAALNAIDFAKRARNIDTEARALGVIGFKNASIGEYTSAIEYYQRSLNLLRQLDDAFLITQALESLQWIYEQIKDHRSSVDTVEELIPLYRQLSDRESLAEAYSDLGFYRFNEGDYQRAIESFQTSLSLYRRLDNAESESTLLFNLGMAYQELGDETEAARFLQESIDISMEGQNYEAVQSDLGQLVGLLSESYAYNRIIPLLEEMIPVYDEEDLPVQKMILLNNIAFYYSALDIYDQALSYYHLALELSLELGKTRDAIINLISLAKTHQSLGEYHLSLEFLDRAETFDLQNLDEDLLASFFQAKGDLYRSWGWYENSLSYYQDALELFADLNNTQELAITYNLIGQVYRYSGDLDSAKKFYENSHELSLEINDLPQTAVTLNNLGEVFRETGNFEEALDYYEQALRIDNETYDIRGIQIRKNNIALIHLLNGDAEKALPYFEQALEYWETIGDRYQQATALQNMADSFFIMGDFEKATEHLQLTVDIFEELKQTAHGQTRQEFVDKIIDVYRSLSQLYLAVNDFGSSLYTIELSKAQFLLEQMGSGLDRAYFEQDILVELLSLLESNQIIVSFTRFNDEDYNILLVSDDIIESRIVTFNLDLLDQVYQEYERQIRRVVGDDSQGQLDSLIRYYRSLLSKPFLLRNDQAALTRIASLIYSLFFKDIEDTLVKYDDLIIIPDGGLGLIPFETLKDSSDQFLIENYNISYAQSLSVLLETIRREYPENRKSVLAFGGALYEEVPSSQNISRGNLEGMRREITRLVERGESTRGIYREMGISNWSSLPGSLEEVTGLGEIVDGARILVGDQVNESLIKELSAEQSLGQYSVLHFATHGFLDTESPQLSAIVLSQFSEERDGEDGYLNMAEIVQLQIQADFVNLSACETGLGRVFRGEGIVGLTQAFLIAGANSLSVSLWQVADESTKEFMVGVYDLVNNQGLSYLDAMSEMKRRFIQSDEYFSPFYWAPFVFYGSFK